MGCEVSRGLDMRGIMVLTAAAVEHDSSPGVAAWRMRPFFDAYLVATRDGKQSTECSGSGSWLPMLMGKANEEALLVAGVDSPTISPVSSTSPRISTRTQETTFSASASSTAPTVESRLPNPTLSGVG